MHYTKHQKQLERILHLLKRLYGMEQLRASVIATEYGKSAKTITRDMQKIANVIPLQNRRGVWSLNVDMLMESESPLNVELLKSFAKNAEIGSPFFDVSNIDDAKVKFAITYKALPKSLGERIITALKQQCVVSFAYVKPTQRSMRRVDPIRLYTQNSRWYLIARDYKDDKIKTFLLSRIESFAVCDEAVTLTQAMLKEADALQNVWRSGSSEAIVAKLYVKPEAAAYIADIPLHPTQEIVDRHYDGGLEVHCTITHKLEILPAIKSWIPNVYILEPKWLWEDLIRDLEYYRDEDYRVDI